jgi:hypothetical protein
MGKRRAILTFLLLAAAVSSGCSSEKSMSRDDARSELKLAASLKAESELFIGYMRAAHATRPLIGRHLNYLEQTVSREIVSLEQATPGPGAAGAIHECMTDLRQLQAQLKTVQEQMKNPDGRS